MSEFTQIISRAGRLTISTVAALLLLTGCNKGADKVTLGYQDGKEPVASSDTATSVSHNLQGQPTLDNATETSGPAVIYLRLTGSLVADLESKVTANASGIVKEIFVDRGDKVSQGEVIAHLDPRDAENLLAEGEAAAEEIRVNLGLKAGDNNFEIANKPEVQQAKAAVDLAEKNYQRDQQLLKQNLVPQEDADKTANAYIAARQSYESAIIEAGRLFQSYQSSRVKLNRLRKAIEDTTITAPFAGVVAQRHVSPGESLSAAGTSGGAVITMMQINPLRLELTVSEQDLSRIHIGQTLDFQVPAYGERSFPATVNRITPKIDAATRSLVVECKVPNDSLELLPGMFATTTLTIKENPDPTVIHRDSLFSSKDSTPTPSTRLADTVTSTTAAHTEAGGR